jgi:SAM-dependent methyltransferase
MRGLPQFHETFTLDGVMSDKEQADNDTGEPRRGAHGPAEAAAWVARFAPMVPAGGPVLDLACGSGRHGRLFLARGHPVTFLDRDVGSVEDLKGGPEVEILQADLEDGRPFPLDGRYFAGVVVTNYLFRPILPDIVSCVAPGGLLIYETFARDNERFGKPSNPDFLLKPGELLDAVRGALRVIAYEDVVEEKPKPAARQRIAARREADGRSPGDG